MQVYFKNSRNLKLFGELVIPENNKHAVIILVHGHKTSHKGGKIQKIFKSMQNSKYVIFMPDLTSHGESEGKDATLSDAIDDVKCAIALMKKRFPTYEIGLLGSSFGGAACFFAAKDASAIVLSSPMVDYSAKMKRIAKLSSLEKRYYEDGAQYDFYERAKRFDIPTLVIAGDEDKEVLISEIRKFYGNISGEKKLEVFSSGHRNSDEQLETIGKLAIDWFGKYVR